MASEAALDLLARRFFAEPNRFRWADIESGQVSPATMARLQPWLDRLRTGNEPIILPFATPDRTVWYVATSSARAFRHVRDDLAALLGLTYSDFDGQPTILDLTHPIEAALATTFGRFVIRIQVRPQHMDAVRTRLELFARLLKEAPQRTETLVRPVGRILADFEEALRRDTPDVASGCIEEFEHNGQLDAQNLLYLRIRLDEGRGNWQAILDAARRYHLVSASRRPRRVSQAILRAVYATTLAAYERTSDAEGAVSQFRGGVYGDYASLLGSRRTYQCQEADALFVMRAVSVPEFRPDLIDVLGEIEQGAPHYAWLAALAAVAPPLPQPATTGMSDTAELRQTATTSPAVVEAALPSDLLAVAREAFSVGDLDRAWDVTRELEASEASAQLIIACACDIGTLTAAQGALDALMALPEATRTALEQRRSVSANLAVLRALVAPADAAPSSIPHNWCDWLDGVTANQDWREAASVAERGSLEWDPREFEGVDAADRFAKGLSRLQTRGYDRISESLPYILASISRCPALPRRFGDVLETLTLIHLCDEAPGRMFFGTLADLCGQLLDVGVTREAYTGLLAECIGTIAKRAGPSDFDGLLELLDVLVTYSAPDAPQRAAVADTIAGLFVRFRGKAEALHLVFLGHLLQDAGCLVPPTLIADKAAARNSTPLAPLDGKSIALYSLNEPALHRIAQLLKDTLEAATVSVFHDKAGGSASLRSAARKADIFVIATAAAKHAATEFIEVERGAQAVTLKPRGQGSASMLHALREHARTLI